MKVAVTCDALVARTPTISIIESVLEVFDEAEVYSIIHHAGKILGPIEQRRIQSTYLSNMVTEERPFGDQFWKKGMLIPGACRNLNIPCSFDLIINISSGFSQGIEKCEKSKQITYLVENIFNARKPKYFREKIFRSYLENWAIKKMGQADELWVLNEEQKEFWSERHSRVSVMSPYFKATDFPLFPEATRKAFPKDFFCIEAASLDEEQASLLVQNLRTSNLKYKFVGFDDHLANLKEREPEGTFYGERCSGELAPLLAACRGYLSFQVHGFPTHAIECLSTGTPIWLPRESEGHQFVDGPGVFGKDPKVASLSHLGKLFDLMEGHDPKKVHGQTTKFHDIKFKAELKRRLNNTLS